MIYFLQIQNCFKLNGKFFFKTEQELDNHIRKLPKRLKINDVEPILDASGNPLELELTPIILDGVVLKDHYEDNIRSLKIDPDKCPDYEKLFKGVWA